MSIHTTLLYKTRFLQQSNQNSVVRTQQTVTGLDVDYDAMVQMWTGQGQAAKMLSWHPPMPSVRPNKERSHRQTVSTGPLVIQAGAVMNPASLPASTWLWHDPPGWSVDTGRPQHELHPIRVGRLQP